VIEKEMRELGVANNDLYKLWKFQVERARAISSYVTGLNVNEFKRQFNADTNRNTVPKMRKLEEAFYKAFRLQDFIRKYQKPMQDQQIAFGFQNSRIPQPDCKTELELKITPAISYQSPQTPSYR
jgi:hypothetical protein